jgi:ribose/xylose/arabinose/galactoside ABC-type transport system permease subunit
MVGSFWGAFMSLFVWSQQGFPVALAVVLTAGVGLFFGLSMAGYYAYGRRKYHLPKWNSILS